jgi:hypothetical protein
MTLILSGTNGVSDIDGSAATPAIRGTDANTGIFFPAADTIAFLKAVRRLCVLTPAVMWGLVLLRRFCNQFPRFKIIAL